MNKFRVNENKMMIPKIETVLDQYQARLIDTDSYITVIGGKRLFFVVLMTDQPWNIIAEMNESLTNLIVEDETFCLHERMRYYFVRANAQTKILTDSEIYQLLQERSDVLEDAYYTL